MTLTYGSAFSGICAPTVAWHPLGMRCRWFAELDPFASAVLASRWPEVPNLGDATKIGEEHGPVDVLVGGPPCQDYSDAGGRAGMDGDRGRMAFEFVRLARRVGARWVVFENVPGLLSSGGGGAFAALLGELAEHGYGVAWRVLDAQYAGLAQRRKRVFAVGYLGDWRPAAAVLLERPSMRWDPPARGGERAEAAAGAGGGALGRGDAPALTTKSARFDPNAEAYVGADVARAALDSAGRSTSSNSEIIATAARGDAPPLLAHHPRDSGDPEGLVLGPAPWAPSVNGSLLAAQGGSGEKHDGRNLIVAPTVNVNGGRAATVQTPLVVTPIQDAERTRLRAQNGIGDADAGSPMYTMTTRGDHAVAFHATQDPISSGCVAPAVGANMSVGVIAFDETQITSATNRSRPQPGGPSPTLASTGRADVVGPHVRPRRLTPREWERLFGLPDDYTAISWRGMTGRGKWRPAKDSRRYAVLGNSIAVPVMAWIGRRLLIVEEILRERDSG